MARPPAGRRKAGKPTSRPDRTSKPLDDVADDVATDDAVEEVDVVEIDAVEIDAVEIDAVEIDPVDDADDGTDIDADVADEVDVADEPDVDDVDEDDEVNDDADDDIVAKDAGDRSRSAAVTAFWTRARVDPVEIALPAGVGYTLRAYRLDTDIVPADVSDREVDVALPARATFDEEEVVILPDLDDPDGEDFDGDDDAEDNSALIDDEDTDDDEDDDDLDEDDDVVAEIDTDDDDDEDDHDAEEVPLFLSQGGHLLLFRSPDSLVDFIRSDAEHDMSQLDTWLDLVDGIRTGYVVPLPDDAYELDLVVQNLRGGHDSWDPQLIVQSGQLARDLAHALHIDSVVLALAPESPLDDLDEALRSVISGGFGGFRARRKVKKIGEQTATLGWRTIIGKISAVVDWRD